MCVIYVVIEKKPLVSLFRNKTLRNVYLYVFKHFTEVLWAALLPEIIKLNNSCY